MPSLDLLLQTPIQHLPSCSATPLLTEALGQLQAADADPRQVAAHLERDPELAARLVATMAERTGRKVPDVLGGLRLLGLKTLEALLIDMTAASEGLDPLLGDLMQGELLEHSQQVAVCSYLISVETGYPQPSEAYAAGWLHDLGHALLEAFPCSELVTALQLSPGEGMAVVTPEDARLGGNHASVGARLLERWQVPAGIVAAVAHHHAPQEAPTGRRLARVVSLAETAVSRLQGGEGAGLAADPSGVPMATEQLRRLAERAREHHLRARLERVCGKS